MTSTAQFYQNEADHFPRNLPSLNFTKITEAAINNVESSLPKGLLVEAPIYFFMGNSALSALYKTGIATSTYFIRSTIKDLTAPYFDKFTSGFLAGGVGGYFKYALTGQNPYVGMANIMAYETCNNIDICSNNPYVNIAFTIAVETLDAALQTGINLAKGNAHETSTFAINKAIRFGAFIYDNSDEIAKAAAMGAKAGAFVCMQIYTTYLPHHEEFSKTLDDIIHTSFNTTDASGEL